MENDWMGDLQRLAAQGHNSVRVVHNPMTPRYWRGETMLSSMIAGGTAIGWFECVYPHRDYDSEVQHTYHVVVYLEHEDYGFLNEEPGYYGVFRMGYDEYDGELLAEYAELFCFYDGQDPNRDDSGNPRLFTKHDAIEFMNREFPEYKEI